mmetsp:Transcript_5812/g.14780  ORF Transcript_5812/g.14780 Transcript_5812/m.14780 type:complete len:376 (-) Transcript_5812:1576-2703(-)
MTKKQKKKIERDRREKERRRLDTDLDTQGELLLALTKDAQFLLATAICHSLPPDDVENGLDALLHVIGRVEGATPQFLNALIQVEAKAPENKGGKNANSVFRGNSIASKALTSYAFRVGHNYLNQTLKPLILSICYTPDAWEVDPKRLDSDSNLDDNVENLRAAAAMFFSKIQRSVDQIPPCLRLVCKQLQEVAQQNYPNHVQQLVGGFFFLRVICPALVSPIRFGVWKDPIPEHAKRPLILVSKTLQCLANAVKFGKKEAYMHPMNTFLKANESRMTHFLNEIAIVPEVVEDEWYASVSEEPATEAFQTLYIIIKERFDEIRLFLETRFPQQVDVLDEVLPTLVKVWDKQRKALSTKSNSRQNTPRAVTNSSRD